MITRLRYNIKFSTTGKSFSNEINFTPGFTVISGKNEGGKSLILEMIEYGLFGSAALRGTASDYDVLDMELEFEARGQKHHVARNGTTHKLDTNKAVGAKAVNAEIKQLLSYDMDVFRVANFAKQGQLNDFTLRMKNTARRKMVDELIGMDQLEAVERICRSESNSNRRLRDDLSKRLIEPTEPEKPQNYRVSLELDMALRKQLETEFKRKQLTDMTKPTLPEEPVKGEFDATVEQHEKDRQSTNAERGILERTLQGIPTAICSRRDFEHSSDIWRQRAYGPYPNYSREELDQFLIDHEEIRRWGDSVVCPACDTRFVPDHSGNCVAPDVPPLSVPDIKAQLDSWRRWGDETPIVGEPVLERSQLKIAEEALIKAETRKDIEAQLEALPEYEDRSSELKLFLAYKQQVAEYQFRLDRYTDDLISWDEAQKELKLLPEPDPDLENNLAISREYEEQKRRFDADTESYSKLSEELEQINKTVEEFNNGAEALKFVRGQIKAQLVPSLNKVASFLLSEMTNGQRTKVVVDEEFNITVDGQPVDTLSGSGVSVVNLALRLALGQVITQSVLPVFMGDELDADMDKDRADATHDALRKVSKMLKQVIVVSHKDIQGETNIGV